MRSARGARCGIALMAFTAGAGLACSDTGSDETLSLQVPLGTTGEMRGTLITFSRVVYSSPLVAYLSLVQPEVYLNASTVSMTVHQGDLVPVRGVLLPVTAITAGGDPAVTVELSPGRGAFQPTSNGLLLTPGAVAHFVAPDGPPAPPDASAELISISPREHRPMRATFRVWSSGVDSAAVSPAAVTTVEVAEGEALVAGGRRYSILGMDPGEPAEGITGLVELPPSPGP
jgi:hypothetical protein